MIGPSVGAAPRSNFEMQRNAEIGLYTELSTLMNR
jgi:hypothetical protein